jgi:hypothetical protein
MYKVAELFKYFVSASKANYWPNVCIALDEAVKKFRIAVALALGKEWEDMGCVVQTQAAVASPRTLLKTAPATKVRISFGAKDSTWFSSNDMHLTFLEKIPVQDKSKHKFRQLTCIYENCPQKDMKHSQRRVSKWCHECSAPLCFPHCFQGFHTSK